MDKIIQFTNRLNRKNITFMYSTPSQYAQELRKDQISWPVTYSDSFPYSPDNVEYWTGYFASRPSQKKLVRDLSSVVHASEKLLAKRALEESVTAEEVNDMVALKSVGLETLGLAQETVTGTGSQNNVQQIKEQMLGTIDITNKLYQKYLSETLTRYTGVKANKDLEYCFSNDTVAECPQSNPQRSKDFYVVVHNPKSGNQTDNMRILLPASNYKPLIWSKSRNAFVETQSFDILEQPHFRNSKEKAGEVYSDFMMFVDYDLEPNEVGFLKIMQTEKPHDFNSTKSEMPGNTGTSLEIVGFTDTNEALFKLTDRDSDF